jgi:F0F1-type ATP synthase assembly protein I
MKTGLTAGSGLILGLVVGVIFFDNPALGMIFGLLLGISVAAARRRRSAPPS